MPAPPPPPTLQADDVCYIVYHHAETTHGQDISAAQIDRFHRIERGWDSNGYHFVIRRSGEVETGRSLTKQGAHARGLNECSIGIVLSGNFDLHQPARAQVESAIDLGVRLARIYDVSVENILGHREINALVAAGRLDPEYRTHKSCPGVKFSMWKLRVEIAKRLHPPPDLAAVQLRPAA